MWKSVNVTTAHRWHQTVGFIFKHIWPEGLSKTQDQRFHQLHAGSDLDLELNLLQFEKAQTFGGLMEEEDASGEQ